MAQAFPRCCFGRLGGPTKARYQTGDRVFGYPEPLAKSYPSSVSWRNETPRAENDAELKRAKKPFGLLWVGRLVKGAIGTACSLCALPRFL